MKSTTLFGTFACALLTFSILGCGATNKLQSITLSAQSSATAGGFYNLVGEGGTVQLVATGSYSNGSTKDLSSKVTYKVALFPNSVDAFGVPMASPPETVQISPTGLLTAVPPFVCSWVDLSSDPTKPSWFLSGSYSVAATFEGITSQPVYIGVASAAGSDADGACGPS